MKFLPILGSTAIAFALALVAKAEDGLLPNPSFELISGSQPAGFRNHLSPPEASPGDNFILDGTEGDTTHTGRRALQFHFPDGAEITQSVWMADPRSGGCRLEPGSYKCSFWVKAESMVEGFHVWVVITEFGADNKKAGAIGRSEYVRTSDLISGDWKEVNFSFSVPGENGAVTVAPSVIFKTSPDALIRPVPADTRVLVDDLQIVKE